MSKSAAKLLYGPVLVYLGASEKAVDETSHKGRVEAVLGRETRHPGVRDALRNDGETDGDPGDGVRHGGVPGVARQPGQDWQLRGGEVRQPAQAAVRLPATY